MDRIEAKQRIDAACELLKAAGWTEQQLDAAISGLVREDAVEQAERLAANA